MNWLKGDAVCIVEYAHIGRGFGLLRNQLARSCSHQGAKDEPDLLGQGYASDWNDIYTQLRKTLRSTTHELA